MPMHDWSRVQSGVCHNFHVLWLSAITNRLNAGLLPEGMIAMAVPLFLHNDFYINVPLESTYMDTWTVLPHLLQELVL